MKPRNLVLLVFLALIAQPLFAQDETKRPLPLSEGDISQEENALLKQAFELSEKGELETSWFLLKAIIEGYGKSSGSQVAQLALANSYYSAGGSEALARAEVLYTEWSSLNWQDEEGDRVLYRLAQLQMRTLVRRDDELHRAEKTLNTLLERFPQTSLRSQVENDLHKIQENLADQDLVVAKFYYTNRGAMAGAEDRLMEILEKYKSYSKTDQVLWLLGKVEHVKEDDEQSGVYLRLLITKYPTSSLRADACDQLGSDGEILPDKCH